MRQKDPRDDAALEVRSRFRRLISVLEECESILYAQAALADPPNHKLANFIFEQLRPAIYSEEMFRADGDCVCVFCGRLYYDHPVDPGNTYNNVLCSGKQVHL